MRRSRQPLLKETMTQLPRKKKRNDNYFHGKKPPVNASLLKLRSLFLSELRSDKGLLFKTILSNRFHLIGTTLLFQINWQFRPLVEKIKDSRG